MTADGLARTRAGIDGPTPETIRAHELVGLSVRVVAADNADLVGVAGRVVDETTNTLRVEPGPDERVRVVPKAGATFEFDLSGADERTAAEGTADESRPTPDDDAFVVVEGRRLVARPARRTQDATGGTTWHSV